MMGEVREKVSHEQENSRIVICHLLLVWSVHSADSRYASLTFRSLSIKSLSEEEFFHYVATNESSSKRKASFSI